MKKGFIVCMMTLFLITYAFSAGVFDNFIDWVCGNGHGHVTVNNIEWHYTIKGGNATLEHTDDWTPTISRNTSGAITIPATLDGYPVVAIGDSAFAGCSGLTHVIIPSSVTTIGNGAFMRCSGLMRVTIPASVTSIGNSVLYDCSRLTSVDVAERNQTYASVDGVLFDKAFSRVIIYPGGRTGGFVIPESITSIGEWAFGTCSGLTNITIPSSVTTIDKGAFMRCSSLTSITLPEGVTAIGDSAFWGCSGLTSITIPSSVTTIGVGAFYECSSLTHITIPSSVTTIGNVAFTSCSSLTHITIPASVTSIGRVAFFNCSSLMRIDVAEENITYTSVDGVLFDKERSRIITYPGGRVGGFVTPESIASIGEWAFSGCKGLTNIALSKNITLIEPQAFSNCSSLTRITIPFGVTTINHATFYNCSNLTRVVIPASVTTINGGFSNCSRLTSITIPASVTSIDNGTFYGCSSLIRIDVAEDNKIYSSVDGVLINKVLRQVIRCPEGKVGTFTLPASVTSIGNGAFHGCSGLTSLTIPEGVTSIEKNAFRECSSLMRITIPKSVTSINDWMSWECSKLTTLIFEGHAPTQVGKYVLNKTSPDLVIYYHEGTTGWTNPWQGVKTQMIKKN